MVFVDTGIKKPHTCYCPEDGRVFKVRSLKELTEYKIVYLDVLFKEQYDEAEELLRRGYEVFLLKDTIIVKKMRNGKKNDVVDAATLLKIPKTCFEKLNLQKLKLLNLKSKYQKRNKVICYLKNQLELENDPIIKEKLKELIKILEKDKEKIMEELRRIADSNDFYRKTIEYFGIDIRAMLVLLLSQVDLEKGVNKLKKYLGLYANAKNYNHFARMILSQIALVIYLHSHGNKKNRIPEKYKLLAQKKPKNRALLEIQEELIKDLRKLYINVRGVTEVKGTQ